jgi:GMP synthase (glutamine-hydrolysing)
MIAVLDFGSQYTHLITRRIRSLGVSAEIFETDIDPTVLLQKNISGIILSGGPNSVYDKNSPKFDKEILGLGIPVLGICYGHQLIGYCLGGKVEPGKVREYGEEVLQITKPSKLFEGLGREEQVWFSHGDEVKKLPLGFITNASTYGAEIAAFSNEDKKIYGIQFHPEVVHTPKGMTILENFIFKIVNHQKDWQVKDLKSKFISEIKAEVADKKVIIGVSGGVDSLVASKLLEEAIGENLHCIFIDTGFMRKNEPAEVKKLYLELGFKNFVSVDAAKDFYKVLKRKVDPEEKRKTFSKEYFLVFERTVKSLKQKEQIEFLAQGTIYPDRIEAAKTSKTAQVIKSHHNTSLPEKYGFKLIEPLKELYKDEVRELGKSLGIPAQALNRHPFPGPGLLIRILGEATPKRIELLREADAIYIQELKTSGEYDKIWQAFAALLPLKSVGVMGDERTYEYILALRAVTSIDAMTADWARIPESLLNKISKRITNEVRGINRVLYDISQKPPATIEYE